MLGGYPTGDQHIQKSFKQVDENSWIVGPKLLRRLLSPSTTAAWNDESDGSSYVLEDLPSTAPAATAPTSSPLVKLVDAKEAETAIWSIGEKAICKVRYLRKGLTAESVTLAAAYDKRFSSFRVPKVFGYAEDETKYYLFLEKLPGRTLDKAWTGLDDTWKRHYVDSIVRVCIEMATWKGNAIGGVDGKSIPEYYLLIQDKDDFGLIPKNCEELGMDCSDLVFGHNDLGPGNIIIEHEPSSGQVGIIDFEIAGFVPREWIRTKFRLSGGMDLSDETLEDRRAWRKTVQGVLKENGFSDVVDKWWRWRGLDSS